MGFQARIGEVEPPTLLVNQHHKTKWLSDRLQVISLCLFSFYLYF